MAIQIRPVSGFAELERWDASLGYEQVAASIDFFGPLQ
jgi:hypothetical protein